ncbi:MAG: hypothetical protein KAJ51_07650 [Thermoplasmata archaeon]|nr:hypothetical protein [Thermoplasmata archaeon]
MVCKNLNSLTRRILIFIILLICIISSCTYFHFWGEANYPSIEYITEHPTEFENKTIIVSGDVIEITKTTSNLKNSSMIWILTIESNNINLKIIAKDALLNIDPKIGDSLKCKGIYRGNNTIEALELHISDQTLVNLIFIRSIIAVPILIVIFVLSWQLHFKQLLFKPKLQQKKGGKMVSGRAD